MKIFYICAVDLSNFDAQRTHVLEVASEMHDMNKDVTLFLPKFSPQTEDFRFKSRYVNIWLWKSKLKFLEYELRLFFILVFVFLKSRPDILYIRKGFLTIFPAILGRCFRIKTVMEINGYIPDEIRLGFGLPEPVIAVFRFIEKWNCLLANHLITVTPGIKNLFMRNYGIAEQKITVIPNGVNTDRFSPNPKTEADKYCLGFVGNLIPWSGLTYLLKSLPEVKAKIPNIVCLIVGDGSIREELDRLTSELDIENEVRFTGMVKPQEVPAYINQCHICLLPAVTRRNAKIGISPIKLYEYLACGVPVIVSDIAGMEVVRENDVGIVVEPENVKVLADTIISLLQDPEKRKQMGIRARSLAVEKFSWKNTTEKILTVCKSLVQNQNQ